MNKKLWSLTPIALALLTACGGSSDAPQEDNGPVVVVPPDGGNGDIAALELPEEIALLIPNDNGDPTPKRGAFKSAAGDFDTDEKRVHVWDEAMQPLTIVNEILCYVGQTGADQIVNETYTALIDTERCRTDFDDDEDTGQSSGDSEEFQLWTIESTRESNDSPQVVKIWVPAEGGDGGEDDPMDQQRILVEVTIDSEGDENNPYGQFTMNWRGVVDMQGNDVTTMQGTIQAALDADSRPNILFFNHGGSDQMGFTFMEATNILLDELGADSGSAKTAFHHSSPHGEFGADFSVSYDELLFLRGKDMDQDGTADEQMCFARNEFDQFVWRYNLYDATDGSRVEINSGFPFYTDIGNERYFGHIGYWGMWLPHEVDMSQVSQIVKQDFENNTETPYDVTHAPGKLIKRTKTTVPLSELEGASLHYGDLRVEYTHDNELNSGEQVAETGFYAVAQRVVNSDGTEGYQDIQPYRLTDDHLFFWSEALGGGVNYDAFADANSVTIYQESFVRSLADVGDGTTSLQLDCYFQCPKANITSDQVNYNNDSPFLDDSQDGTPTAVYTFDFSTLTLTDANGNPIALAADAQVGDNSPHHWGLQSGNMLVSGTAVNDQRDLWNAEVSYVWETGHNHWNQTTVVSEVGSDSFVEFDKPMNFVYTHSSDNDLNADANNPSPFDGQAFMLHYGGPGELWGIPHEQGQNDRWSPLFSLSDGTTLGDGAYMVKGIDVEQRLRNVDNSECSANNLSLDSANSLVMPSESDITEVTINWSDKPEVDTPPRVIGGEIQG